MVGNFPEFRIPSSVETPAVCVDRDLMEANIRRMAEGLREQQIAFRPHVKSHKSLVIARKQLDAGAVGLTAATLGEAEVFVGGGFRDIFIAYPIWFTDQKAGRLRALLESARVAIGVSSVEGAENLAARVGKGPAVEVLIEVDSGEKRTGVTSPAMGVQVANAAARSGLTVKGVFTHGGHSYAGGAAVQEAAEDESRVLAEVADALRAAGHHIEVQSAGSTPTALRGAGTSVTEERPGTFVFGDRQQVAIGGHAAESVALYVACTVVEVRAGQFVLDAGAKVLTKDSPKTVEGFGALPEYPQATVTRLFDHDAVVSCTTGRLPKIGDRVALIPNHVCPVSNLADEFVIVDSLGNIEDHWPIDARHRNR